MDEHLYLQRRLACLAVLCVPSPILAFLTVTWMLGGTGLAFHEFVALAVLSGLLAIPLATAGWRILYRPQLVIEADVLKVFAGRRLISTLSRHEIQSIEVRETNVARFAVARTWSGAQVDLVPPFEPRLRKLRDPAFDERIVRLNQWRLNDETR